MNNSINTNIESIVLHKVGNKHHEEPIVFSDTALEVDDELNEVLSIYFQSHFKSDEQYRFFHDSELELNETYHYVSAIFNNPESIIDQSKNLAKHLYNHSIHPNINGGEFYVVYFKDNFAGVNANEAIGLFKTENKDIFLETDYHSDHFEISTREGININKLDKGCIIYNNSKTEGYILSIVDNINKEKEARYWRDDFLGVVTLKNDFQQTNQFMGITKQFLTKQLPEEYEVNKTDQIELMNKTMDFFKNNETFEKEKFENEVFHDKALIESFKVFDNSYKEKNEIDISDNFDISTQAVKKQSRVYKSVLKLDKNFHIYIHGDKDLIEQGIDENGKKFYKIYYENES